ncbi:MAG: hypothetical protein OD918_11105, partial [Gammaproteobacteria bacterium]
MLIFMVVSYDGVDANTIPEFAPLGNPHRHILQTLPRPAQTRSLAKPAAKPDFSRRAPKPTPCDSPQLRV